MAVIGQARMQIGALAIAALLSAAAHAQASVDDAPPRFTFNAFGTLGVVHSSSDQVDFVRSIVPPHGAGYSNEWATQVDSSVRVLE